MKVLLTGAFGNIGESILLALMEKGYNVRCFDIETERNRKTYERLSKSLNFEMIWGDITKKDSLGPAVENIDSIIHLAAMIPPLSEKNPDLAKRINVDGTRNILEVAGQMEPKPRFIFSSSVSIHGPRHLQPPPVKVDEPLVPTDNYTHHKVECEKMIRESALPWTIFRFAAVPPLEIGGGDIDPSFFDTPFEQRIEFAHTRDVGTACANVIEAETLHKTLMIGGGEKCQHINGDFINLIFDAMGMGKLPREAFRVPEKEEDWYYTDWMDTAESQALLKYQTLTYEDYLEEMKKKMGIKRYISKLLAPIIRRRLLKQSPYYRKNRE